MPTFFDLLPEDVHDRIAHFLYSSTRSDDEHYCNECLSLSVFDDNLLDTLLHYAKSSPTQCRSVVRALYKRLYVTIDWRSQRITEWISVCSKYLRTIQLSESPRFAFTGGPPRLPQLERVVMTLYPEQVSLIHGSPKLRHLTVYITNSSAWESFVSALSSLQLEVLRFFFLDNRTLHGLSRTQLTSLCSACPAVEELYFEPYDDMTEAAWDMIKGMPSLKKLGVIAPIAEAHIPFVQTLPQVGLWDVFRIENALQFGPSLTSLGFLGAKGEHIMRLKSLPNLRQLWIKPLNGHERALVGKIGNVEELRLAWYHKGCEHSYESPIGAILGWHPMYHEPDGKVLEEILRSAKHLKSLQIKRAIISSEVIIRLLKVAGDKVETLGICHDWQKEPVADRMETILRGIACYCPNLKTLVFKESSFPHQRDRLPIFATEHQNRRCLGALEEVVERIPGFESYRHVRSTILHRFTEEPFELMLWHNMLNGPCVPGEDLEDEEEDWEGEEEDDEHFEEGDEEE